MTTKELTETIVSDLMAEIPIESRNAQDKSDIEDEMSALIHGHVEMYRQQVVCDTIKYMKEEILNNSVRWGSSQSVIDDFERAMLNENKE